MGTNFGGVPLLGAIAGCHGWMPSLLDASGAHDCWVPLLGAIARKLTRVLHCSPLHLSLH